MKNIFILLIFSTLLIYSCSESSSSISDNVDNAITDDNDDNNNTNSWLIDKDLVFDGGPGKDGIPALDNPTLITQAENDYLSDEDLVIGLKFGDQVVAFPHKILDWHEIINTDIDNLSLAIIYCPLTGTAVGWDRNFNNTKTTFGVSGLLYKNNIIPYDRATDSNWSQLKLQCVNGKLIGENPIIIVLPEMKWGLWRKLYKQTKLVSTKTGHQRNYNNYPYGDYKTDNQYFIFPIDPLKNNISAKERVHAIIYNNQAKIYRFNDFGNGKIITDTFQNKEYIIIGNQDFIISFEITDQTSNLEFTYNFKDTEIILSDNEGNNWNLFGEAISGPRKGTFLETAKTSMMGYYFSMESFYPNLLIYN